MQNFWSAEDRLSGATCERALCLFERLFAAEAEDAFLTFATSLLLELTSRSPDYRRPMLPDPLSPDCAFASYLPEGLAEGGRTRGTSLMPLFLEASAAGDRRLLATQREPAVAATEAMDDGTGRAFNWLTQVRARAC